MSSGSGSASATATLLTEAKKEYTKQIVSFLATPLYDTLYVQWSKSVEDNPSSPMQVFQDKLSAIAEWDDEEKKTECQRCLSESQCSYIDDLIAAVFIAHTKVLASIRNEETIREFQIEVPGSIQFVHECLVQCAREFWKSPYLFYQNEAENKISRIQIQKNLREAEGVIKEAIEDTIRKMLPVKEILQEYLEEGRESRRMKSQSQAQAQVSQTGTSEKKSLPKKQTDTETDTLISKTKTPVVNQTILENIREQFENLSGNQTTEDEDKEADAEVSSETQEDVDAEADAYDGLENWTGVGEEDEDDSDDEKIQFVDEPGKPLEEMVDELGIEDLTPEKKPEESEETSASSFIDEVLE
jgi:hypothetical protein